MTRSAVRGFLLLLFVSAGIVLAVGCENTVEPVSEEGAYAVYGTLTSQPEPKFIRVRPLRQPIGVSLDSLDATVTLTNQSSGTTRPLQDSVVTFDGVATHNYWTDFQPEPATTYELTVDGPGGTTRSQTTIPTSTAPTVDPDSAQSCATRVDVLFPAAAEPVGLSVGFQYKGTMHFVSLPVQGPDPVPDRDGEGVRLFPECVLREVISGGPNRAPRCTRLDDSTLYLAYRYVDPERDAIVDDADQAFDPTESRRVDQGTGFFGAVRRDTVTMAVNTTEVGASGQCPEIR